MKVRKAVIPAAGMGTRFLPATKAQPKEMLPIVDKPTIQYIIEEAVASGVEDILIVSGRGKRAIEDHFDKSYELEDILRRKGEAELLELVQSISNLANVNYVRQKEPKGLGHAIYCARSFIGDEPFAILLGDDIVDSSVPCLKQMIDVYEEYGATVLGVQQVPDSEVSKYGIIKGELIGDRVYRVEDMVEKPDIESAPSNVAILGRYIVTPDLFTYLENAAPGKGGEIQLTDALRAMLATSPVFAYDFIGKRYDVGNKLGFLEATVEFALKRDELRDEFAAYLKNRLNSL
ncbi:MAG TPA: UTP--glucose-1-phosphate uridylyltransferase GalU [Clostridiales bacterium]|nr:UTP--glucose-1-phosphate uridylyltransferase GalU [Clostridiales bacterium]HPV02018.1 UTP--glucose-1-phosphate uridylyltransferase GalU [Clostridiales bacterium]